MAPLAGGGKHRVGELVLVAALLCLAVAWLQSLSSVLLPAGYIPGMHPQSRLEPLPQQPSDGRGDTSHAPSDGGRVAGGMEERLQEQVGDLLEEVVADAGSFGLIAFGNTSSKLPTSSAEDLSRLSEEELSILQQRRILLENSEEIDLIVRMPDAIIPVFALVCSSVCSDKCEDKAAEPVGFLHSPVKCYCADVFAVLLNISRSDPLSSSWGEISDVSFTKQQRTFALCTTMRNCALLGERGHPECAEKANAVVQASSPSRSAPDVRRELEQVCV